MEDFQEYDEENDLHDQRIETRNNLILLDGETEEEALARIGYADEYGDEYEDDGQPTWQEEWEVIEGDSFMDCQIENDLWDD